MDVQQIPLWPAVGRTVVEFDDDGIRLHQFDFPEIGESPQTVLIPWDLWPVVASAIHEKRREISR